MLINPFREELDLIPGTPFIQAAELMQLVGARVQDTEPYRIWTIQGFLRPSFRRAIAGVRAKLYDEKGFITFLNQRDMEVLLGLGVPGQICPWWGRSYAGPGDLGWVGLCADEEDLRDDLYERELFIRQELQHIPEGVSLLRKVHVDAEVDVEETWIFLHDTGAQHEKVLDRWARVERVKVTWKLT
jgi:hypothetical protein